MSSKTRILAFAIAFAFMAGFAFSAQADVTGSFTTSIGVFPAQDVAQSDSERQVLDFDIQNAINITVAISGLQTTLHSHFGLAGIEDVALSYAATLGALDINGQFVWSRFAAADSFLGFGTLGYVDASGSFIANGRGNPFPQQDELRFIKKRVKTSISLGGVSFSNLAMFEDVTTNGPVINGALWGGNVTQPGPTWNQTPQYAFGDVITLSGQTPSGINISAETGICAEPFANIIKKHKFQYRVNPHCGGVEFVEGQAELSDIVKPNLAFDFENLTISGIPVADGVRANAVVTCVQTTQCELTNTFTFSGMGPIPFSASFTFVDLFTLAFGGADLTFSTGAGELVIGITPDGTLETIDLDLSTTLNPDTNPATFSIDSTFVPGTGLTSAEVGLDVSRSNVTFGMVANFGPTGTAGVATFTGVDFSIETTVGAFDFSTEASFGEFGFQQSTSSFTINF